MDGHYEVFSMRVKFSSSQLMKENNSLENEDWKTHPFLNCFLMNPLWEPFLKAAQC